MHLFLWSVTFSQLQHPTACSSNSPLLRGSVFYFAACRPVFRNESRDDVVCRSSPRLAVSRRRPLHVDRSLTSRQLGIYRSRPSTLSTTQPGRRFDPDVILLRLRPTRALGFHTSTVVIPNSCRNIQRQSGALPSRRRIGLQPNPSLHPLPSVCLTLRSVSRTLLLQQTDCRLNPGLITDALERFWRSVRCDPGAGKTVGRRRRRRTAQHPNSRLVIGSF